MTIPLRMVMIYNIFVQVTKRMTAQFRVMSNHVPLLFCILFFNTDTHTNVHSVFFFLLKSVRTVDEYQKSN